MIRVFTRFQVRKMKENGSGSHSASGPAHGMDAGPVRFGPTRTCVAALVSAPHACSQLGVTCTAAPHPRVLPTNSKPNRFSSGSEK